MTLRPTILMCALGASACCIPFGGDSETNEATAPPPAVSVPAAPAPPALTPVTPPAYHRQVQGPWGSMWLAESFEPMPTTDPTAVARWASLSLRTSIQLFRYAMPPGEPPSSHVPTQIPPALSAGGSPAAYDIDIGGVHGQRWDIRGFDAEQYTRRGYAVRWDYGGQRYVVICDSTYGDAPIHCLQAIETLRPPA